MGLNSAKDVFESYAITGKQIQELSVPTYMMVSKDDPIVSYNSMPFDSIEKNKNIKLVATEKGGHLCWFEGIIPKRWYPKPAL